MRLINVLMTRLKQLRYGGRLSVARGTTLPADLLVRVSKGSSVSIGKDVHFRSGVIINTSDCGVVSIGDRVFFNDRCCLNSREEINIGDDSIIGQGVLFYDHDHDYRLGSLQKKDHYRTDSVSIGKRVWIGSNAVILRGVSIGDNSIVGAGCVVRESIPENTLFFMPGEYVMKGIGEYCHETVRSLFS